MENKMVTIKSTINATVVIDSPSNNLRRTWSREGAIQKIPFDVLEVVIYEPGVEYLFKTGILYIEDFATKVALGLEEEGQKPQIQFVDEKRATEILNWTYAAFVAELQNYTNEQKKLVAQTAIKIRNNDLKKSQLLTEETGIEVAKAINLAIQEEQAVALKAKSASK